MQPFKIRDGCQVANLNKTGFTPGRDLCDAKKRRVSTSGSKRAVILLKGFNKYSHIILVIAPISAHRTSVCPVFFRGQLETIISNGPVHHKVRGIVTPLENVFLEERHCKSRHQYFSQVDPCVYSRNTGKSVWGPVSPPILRILQGSHESRDFRSTVIE